MDTLSYKTVSANAKTVTKNWILIDAESQQLGRLSSYIAKFARGKFKPNFTPHVDCGDNVIIINAEKVVLSGKKEDEKVYVRHTGYPGGQRFTSPKELREKHPERIVKKAVVGMLPKTRLGRAIAKNVYVYTGNTHPHEAQQPKTINLNQIK